MIYQEQRYDWRPGTRIAGIDAQVAGERLATLAQKYGRVTPDLVVNDARPEDAPLHGAFTWDDGEAADKYRRHEARQLIGAVVVFRVAEEQPTAPIKTTRAFVNLEEPTTHDRMYMPIAAVLSDKHRRRILLGQAYKDYKMWEAKYHELAELAEIFATAERVLTLVVAELEATEEAA